MTLVADGDVVAGRGARQRARARRVRAARRRARRLRVVAEVGAPDPDAHGAPGLQTRDVSRVSAVHVLDPLTDTRWDDFVERHPRASVFHSRGWLEALKRTYGYEPIVADDDRAGAAGERPGAVPRQDLAVAAAGVAAVLGSLRPARRSAGRPVRDARVPGGRDGRRGAGVRSSCGLDSAASVSGLAEGASYCLHTLDLARPAEQIFDGFHHSSTQRAIRRAEREGLTYEAGTSERLLSSFYGLLRLTRRRHGLPPQPLAWFRNLVGVPAATGWRSTWRARTACRLRAS